MNIPGAAWKFPRRVRGHRSACNIYNPAGRWLAMVGLVLGSWVVASVGTLRGARRPLGAPSSESLSLSSARTPEIPQR